MNNSVRGPDTYLCKVFQPNINLNHLYHDSSVINHAVVDIFFTVGNRVIEFLPDGSQNLISRSLTKHIRKRLGGFNLHDDFHRNIDATCKTLSECLSSLRIDHGLTVQKIIEKVILFGQKIENVEGRRVLPIRVGLMKVESSYVHYERYINRVIRESITEFERRNNGMIPASKSSLKRLLEKVEVVAETESSHKRKRRRVTQGTDESQIISCTICLEELAIGSIATRMPCSHTFHGDCIEKWLNQSHYCPICRYELPTV